MLPKLLVLPFCDLANLVKVGVKPIPSTCIRIGCDTSPFSLQVVVQVIPQSQDLVCASKVWYSLSRAPLLARLDTFAGSGALI